jgi:O-succinylbenzoic acid--CoA ligase
MLEPLDDPAVPWLWQRARRTPRALALRHDDRGFSFAELAVRCEATARRLRSRGVEPGDRVALLCAGSIRFVELLHAVQRLQATLVPLNVRLTAAEVAELLEDCQPRLLVFDAASSGFALDARAATLCAIDADSLQDGPDRGSLPSLRVDPDSIHTIVYTSGTTGKPKGAMLSHANHFASAAASRANLGARHGDRWLDALPLHHVGGLSILLRSVVDGSGVVLHGGFDADRVDRSLREDGITLTSMVATMLRRVVQRAADRPYPSSLRAVLVGGGPVPAALLEQSDALGLPALATYGLTETASQVATWAVGSDGAGRAGAGRAIGDARFRIADPDEKGHGEILVSGPTVMAGYFRRPADSERALRDGWLHTGDIGHLNESGCLHVHDRRSDLIVSGGENVYPAEVEAVLLSHPDVSEAAVYPLADLDWGQRVSAAVVLHPGRSLRDDELRAWCATRLARFKLPRNIRFVTSLPRTASGKVKRRELT